MDLTQFFIFVGIGIAGYVFGRVLGVRVTKARANRKAKAESTSENAVSVEKKTEMHLKRMDDKHRASEAALDEPERTGSPHSKKENAKELIIDLLTVEGSVKNDDVEEYLGVSDRTATRYLNELRDEGAIEKKGKGRGTHYVIKH